MHLPLPDTDATMLANLPVELIPLILQHLIKPQHLALCCRVSKLFHELAMPLLYERAFIYAWYKEGKQRVGAAEIFAQSLLISFTSGNKAILDTRQLPTSREIRSETGLVFCNLTD